jgi:OFA family oxalate/formate antiporter-like MFS transporter
VLAAAVLLQQAYGLVFAWGVLVPYVRAELGWSSVLTGAVFSATPLGYGLGTLVGGRLAERLPHRRICAAGVVLLAVGLGGALAVPDGFTFVVLYGWLALGVGGGIALTGSVAAVVRAFPSRAGAAGGVITAAYAMAAVIQAPLLAWLAPSLGWLGALRLLAALLSGLALLALVLMPSDGNERASDLPESAARPGQLSLLRRRRVWTGCVLILLPPLLGTYAAVNVTSAARAGHLAAWVGATAVVLFGVGNASGRLLAGVVADRLGVDPVALAVLLFDVSAAILFALGLPTLLFLAAALAAGTALGGGAGLPARMAADGAPDATSSAFGLLFAAYASGALLGPLVGALAGGGPRSWLVVGLPAAVGFVVVVLRTRSLSPRDAGSKEGLDG